MSAATILSALMLAIAAAPANAPDWWLLPGQPGDRSIMFVDAGTLVRQGGDVSLSVLRIDRAGRSHEQFETIACRRRAEGRSGEALRRFACAPADERIHHGLIVAGMTPAETARMIFGGSGAAELPPV